MTSDPSSLSRRAFVATGAAAAAHVWIPTPTFGYSASEAATAVANGVGMSKWDLDTPALCVDLDAAKKCGFRTAFVHRPKEWGHEPPPSPEPNPHHDFVARDFPELARLLGAAT